MRSEFKGKEVENSESDQGIDEKRECGILDRVGAGEHIASLLVE